MKWPIVKLSEIAAKTKYPIGDGDHGSIKPSQYINKGVPYIRVADMLWDGVISEKDMVYISEEVNNKNEKSKLYPGDIIISKTGATIGKVAIIPTKFKVANTTASIGKVTVDTNKVFLRYVFWAMKSPNFQSEMWKVSKKSAQPGFNVINLKNFTIPLPPLPVQKQIADTLDKADALRQKDQQLLQKYDELAQAIFYEMFGDPLKNDYNLKIARLGELVQDKSELVDGPFGSSVNVKTDYVSDGEIPVIRTKNVSLMRFVDEDLKFMTRQKYERVKRSQVLPGDIIITKVGTIGNVCFFPAHLKEGVLSTTGSCRFRPSKDVINSTYLIYHLLYQRPLLNEMAAEGVQPFLNMSHIKSIPIMQPPMIRQLEFEKKMRLVNTIKEKAEAMSSNSDQLFDSCVSTFF